MKVLLDTNIILDFALERDTFYSNSIQVLSFVYQKQIEGYISASTFSDLYYIIRKDKGRVSALSLLNRIVTFCQVATVDQAVISMALSANFKDFEDAIQSKLKIVLWKKDSAMFMNSLILQSGLSKSIYLILFLIVGWKDVSKSQEKKKEEFGISSAITANIGQDICLVESLNVRK